MARFFMVAAALWLLPASAAAQDRLLSAPVQMGLPSASLDRAPLDASVPRDLFRATPTTFDPRFHEPPRFDPRFLCCDGFGGGPVFAASAPWWTPPPQVVYVPVILPWGSDPRAAGGQTPGPAPPPQAAPPPTPLPPPTPGTPKTFYVIPRCYAGDRPPVVDALPPGCDIKQLRTIPPRIP